MVNVLRTVFSRIPLLALSLLIVWCSNNCSAQEDVEDFSYSAEQDTIAKEKHPSKKAILYSAVLPGAGQVYNHIHLPRESRRKWNVYWKVPMIYGALGGSVFMLVRSQLEIGKLKNEYKYRVQGIGGPNADYSSFDTQAITQLVSTRQTQRDIFVLTSVLVYLINILDANIEAHFINFDVSRDLSMHIRPVATVQGTFGLGMKLKFN